MQFFCKCPRLIGQIVQPELMDDDRLQAIKVAMAGRTDAQGLIGGQARVGFRR